MQGHLDRFQDGQRLKYPRGEEKTYKCQFWWWKKRTPALAILLPFLPSSVFTLVDGTSFLELPSRDQHTATLPFLMPVARTGSVQDHFAVLGSQDPKIAAEGMGLRRVGSPASCYKSFVFHVT